MKHFNFLSNFRWFTTVILLITFGIGQMWGTTTTVTTTSGTSWTVDGRTWTAATDVANVSGSKPYLAMKSNSSNITVNSTMSMDLSGTKTVTVTVGAGYYGGSQASVTAKLVNSSGTTISNVGSATPSTNGNKSYTITLTPTDRTVTDAKVIIGVSSATANSKYIRLYSFAINYTGKPLITVSKTSITGLNYDYGSGPSASQTFTVTGVELGANITVTAPTNFEVCTTSGGTYTSSVTLTRSGTSVATTTIYVRLAAGKAVGSYGGASTYVTATSTNATTKNVSVSGTVASVASCDANPSIGDASLNGSISLSSIPLSISSVGGGTDCTLAEYGFVWKAGSAPSASDNKTKIGESSSATSFTGNITGSFSTGVTYYIKGYAINNGPNTTLSSTALTITPRSITFNSNGGSSVSTIYVNSGTAASAPTAPTKTGYNFGGWYTDNGTFASAVNWSSMISENKTYFAKWTAKTTTISFNQNSGTGGQTGTLTATYDAAMPSAPVTCPTRTGYDFGGYYDGSGGTGTQYYTNTGASARNWDKENSTWTLYAKWTIKSYSVTWKVNNTNYTTGTPTSSVNHGSHVTTLPTAPDPGSYCGDKFMGWTDATDGAYVHGTSNLYTSASQFPAATGNQIFYAVFADYED